MKYILIIVICFMGLATKAQVQKQGRSNFPTVVDSSLAIGKNFILPVFRSFSQLATYTNLDSSGRLVFIRDSNAVFYRTNAHTWAKLSTGSGSGSVSWGSITGTLSNQTDLQAVLDTKVDSVILRGGDSLYNHYATGEVQFIGVVSGGGSTGDTLFVRTPLKVTSNNDTLYQNQVSDVDSGWVSPDQKAYWDAGGFLTLQNAMDNSILVSDVPVINARSNNFGIDSINQLSFNFIEPANGFTDVFSSVVNYGANTTSIEQKGLEIALSSVNSDGGSSFGASAIGGNIQSYSNDLSKFSSIRSEYTPGTVSDVRISSTDSVLVYSPLVSFMNGNVGIGTTTPDSGLTLVNKGFKYDVASKGAGKVLTSDANGAATWQTPSILDTTSLSNRINLKANINSPTLITPTIGVATATSINKVTITAPATSATLTILNGKTLTANNSLTLAGTDATIMTFPSTNATIARTDAAQSFTGTQTFQLIAPTNIIISAYGALLFGNRGGFDPSADGVMRIYNNAGTGFARLCLGLATSSFPALSRSGTTMAVVLADGSGDAPMTASNGTYSGNVIVNGTSSVIRLKGYTVATLPAGTQGDNAYVTDALAPTFLGALTGGGATVTPVFYNGTIWVAH